MSENNNEESQRTMKLDKQWKIWAEEEISKFKQLQRIYDKDYDAYLKHFPDRSYNQIKSHYHNENYRRQKNKMFDKMMSNQNKYNSSQPRQHHKCDTEVPDSSQHQKSAANTSMLEDLFISEPHDYSQFIRYGK